MNEFFYIYIVPYLEKRFGSANEVEAITTKFKKDKGVLYKVGLDCIEAKFHSRFSEITNKVSHTFLQDFSKLLTLY